jgi:hypothetical protein
MSVKTVIFLSLVLDLFGKLLGLGVAIVNQATVAFTIPLPLFPRIVEWYTQVWTLDLL